MRMNGYQKRKRDAFFRAEKRVKRALNPGPWRPCGIEDEERLDRRYRRAFRFKRLAQAACELALREDLPPAWENTPALAGVFLSAGFDIG